MNLVNESLKMAQYKADTLYYKDTFNARKIRRLPVVSSGIFNVSISLESASKDRHSLDDMVTTKGISRIGP